jgi:hypothetical protein
VSVAEQAVLNFLAFETSDDDGDTWVEWTGKLRELSSARGGKRAGATLTVELGTLTATLVNADTTGLKPNVLLRFKHRVTDDTVFTGRFVDLYTAHKLDKSTGKFTRLVTIVAADSVRSHAAVTRHGAVTSGGAGFETWAQRIARLASSAVTTVNAPADDSPIVRYAI